MSVATYDIHMMSFAPHAPPPGQHPCDVACTPGEILGIAHTTLVAEGPFGRASFGGGGGFLPPRAWPRLHSGFPPTFPTGHTLVGYVLSSYTYSSWKGKNLYIDNFYVMPEFRGELGKQPWAALGIGSALPAKACYA